MKIRLMILPICLCLMLGALTAQPTHALFLDQWIIQSVVNQKTPQDVYNAIPSAKKGEMKLAYSTSGLTKSQLIAVGRFLFNNATFNGNGRTCATCHPATNNFTIDPQFIDKLPKNDPLFVAENNPALKDLENPQLMRSLGLICENVDGFDKPCVFRGVPHTLALRTSTTPPQQPPPNLGKNVIVPGTTVELANSTGWSADGAPIDPTGNGARGELRLFALGAIAQHFTKTLNRTPGVDFRVPSDLELDALLEFQLSLGRQAELNLSQLTFKNPIVEFGKIRFQDNNPTTGGRCAVCHNNGGATVAPGPGVPLFVANFNLIGNTGVEHTVNTAAFLLNPDIPIPVDGGFGKPPALGPIIPNVGQGFGDGTFDAPVVIEAAATPPYFHNNSVATLEAAVGFYCSPEFQERLGFPPPTGINFAAPLTLKTDLATSIAAFLRAAGSLELIDRGIGNNQAAIEEKLLLRRDYIDIALANTRDAIKVLKEGIYLLYPETLDELTEAYNELTKARQVYLLTTQSNKFLNNANVRLSNAKSMIIE